MKRRRPRDRRRQILLNASELFTRTGFHAVRMEDIAEASDVTSRAIYRHFASKQDLLSHVIRDDQDRLLAEMDAAEAPESANAALEGLVSRLAEASTESLRLGPLWQREARNLRADDFGRVRDGTRTIGRAVREAIEAARPEQRGFRADVRAWMAVSILTSPGHHEPSLPRRRLINLLRAATLTAVETPDAALEAAREVDSPGGPPDEDRLRTARREQLIAAAASAFRERGYGGVSLDEFGIAGPAVYRYFDSKADVLATLINRLQEWMALESSRALSTNVADDEVIRELVRGYVRVATEATDLLAVWVTEPLNLPAREAERERRIRQDDLDEWVKWLRVARADLPEADAHALVNAVRTVINDLVRIPHLTQDRDFPLELFACSMNILLRTRVP